jgi:two-component system sensor histidine kinase DegS
LLSQIKKSFIYFIFALAISGLLMALYLQRNHSVKVNLGKNINISGKQRMLSQKIVSSALLLTTASRDNYQMYQKSLNSLIAIFEQDHCDLEKGRNGLIAPDELNPAIERAYHTKPIDVHNKITQYIKHAKTIGSLSQEELTTNHESLTYLIEHRNSMLQSLDRVVKLYEEESQNLENEQHISIIIGYILLIIILLLLSQKVFLPMLNELSLLTNQLEEQVVTELQKRVKVERERA